MSAPESAAVTPGQAAEQLAQAAREAFLGERGDPVLSWKALGDGDRRPWFAVVRTIGAAIAARQPQPAPGCPDPSQHVVIRDFLTGHELSHAETDGQQPAPELAAAIQDIIDRYPEREPAPELAAAPELRAAMRETSKAQAALARVLSWFAGNGTHRAATVTRAQLANAYRDSGLTVPEELRRFL